ncbi:MAG: response regulator transcription factor [Ruminococcaceae bacterium]|nr:response regulator transcription factor [Oscillospiraceae bacterium]
MACVLICDDERDIVNALKIYLSAEGHKIVEAFDGEQAIRAVRENDIQLVLMDIMMPQTDGITAMVEIRKMSNVPVILLTAKSEDTDKVLGLDLGADDYITKPFNPAEVIARVRSQLLRYTRLGAAVENENTFRAGNIELNDEAKTVTRDGEEVALTPTEYELLKILIKNPDKVFSSPQLYEMLSGSSYGNENSIAVHIRHLREKLEINPNEPQFIKVVWGQGYKIVKDRR